MKGRLCPNCKYALNEWQTWQCPECGVALEVAVGGSDADTTEEVLDLEAVEDPADGDDAAIEEPKLKKVSVEQKVVSLASAIWSELRCRSYSLDSERWTRVVQELLQELIDEFKERIAKADSLYQSRLDECQALTDRLRRYHKKYGCIHCGKPVPAKSNTDQCNVCCHLSQGEAARKYQEEKRNAGL